MRSEKSTFVLPVNGANVSVKKYVVWGSVFFQVDFPNDQTPLILTKMGGLKKDSWVSLSQGQSSNVAAIVSHLNTWAQAPAEQLEMENVH